MPFQDQEKLRNSPASWNSNAQRPTTIDPSQAKKKGLTAFASRPQGQALEGRKRRLDATIRANRTSKSDPRISALVDRKQCWRPSCAECLAVA